MMKNKSVPLGPLTSIFAKHGVDAVRMNVVIGFIVSASSIPDREERAKQATKSVDVLAIDDMPRAMLKLEAMTPLMELADAIHSEFTESKITSWVVKDHVILLEMI